MGFRDWAGDKVSALKDRVDAGRDKSKAAKDLTSAKAEAAPESVKKPVGFIGRETLAGVRTTPFAFISKFLIVFLFAVMGYNFGFPLIVPTWIANGIWGIISLFVGLFGIPGIPSFLFDYALVAVKNTTGFFLNGWFGFWIIKKWNSDKSNIGRFFVHLFIVFPLLWMWFSMALTVAYTGYVPIITPLTDTMISPTLCDFQSNIQTSVGLSAPGCSISELEVQIGLLAERQQFSTDTQTGLLGGLFGSLSTNTQGGVVFKSQEVSDSSIINRGAGSSISNLRSPKISYTSYGGSAEDLKFLANLETKSLFLSNLEDSKIKISIDPIISDTVCSSCATQSCTAKEINTPFTATVNGTKVVFFKGEDFLEPLREKLNELGIIDVNDCTEIGIEYSEALEAEGIEAFDEEIQELKCFEKEWCSSEWVCNIPGATPVEDTDNTFEVGSGYNQQISCVHAGLSLNEDEVTLPSGKPEYPNGKPIPIYVDLSYDTRATAQKQFFIIDRSISSKELDPINTLGLSEFIISKSYSDGKVSLGIGSTNSYDFIAPTSSLDYTPSVVDLGVSFKMNAAGGYAIEVADATLWIQVVDPGIKFLCGNPPKLPERAGEGEQWEVLGANECDERDTSGFERSGNFIYKGTEDGYAKFRLNPLRADKKLSVGDVVNYDVQMFVPEEVLAGSNYQGILVEAEINYTYTSRNNLMLRVTPDEFPQA